MLTADLDRALTTQAVSILPSGGYRTFPPLGNLEWVSKVSHPPFTPRTKSRIAKFSRGLKYEQIVHTRLSELYDKEFQPGPWFCYKSEADERRKYCQLDGILSRADGSLVLLEVKYNHTPDAYFQLNNLYLPVVRKLYPTVDMALCEVVKWYDPATVFPSPVQLLPRIHEAKAGVFSVHILNR